MNSFLQKLWDNTNSGQLDYVWKYSDGTKRYTFVIPKHYLNGMNFSLEGDDSGAIVFPNGFLVKFGKADMNKLKDVVDVSLERTVDTSMSLYATEDTNDVQTSDPTKQPVEPVSTEEKPETDKPEDSTNQSKSKTDVVIKKDNKNEK